MLSILIGAFVALAGSLATYFVSRKVERKRAHESVALAQAQIAAMRDILTLAGNIDQPTKDKVSKQLAGSVEHALRLLDSSVATQRPALPAQERRAIPSPAQPQADAAKGRERVQDAQALSKFDAESYRRDLTFWRDLHRPTLVELASFAVAYAFESAATAAKTGDVKRLHRDWDRFRYGAHWVLRASPAVDKAVFRETLKAMAQHFDRLFDGLSAGPRRPVDFMSTPSIDEDDVENGDSMPTSDDAPAERAKPLDDGEQS